MSLSKNAPRTANDVRPGPAFTGSLAYSIRLAPPAPPAFGGLPAPAAPAPAPAVRAAPAGHTPAWHLLDTQTGIQDIYYGESGRPEIRKMMSRAPVRVLDIGCANGAVGELLKKSFPGAWVWGCELNELAARMAATRLDHVTTAPSAQWSTGDLALLGTVDTVLLLDVLEHMYNPWAELQFLSRRLPAGAQVIVSLPNFGHLGVLHSLAQGRFDYEAMGILDVTHVRFFTPDGMQAMFRETGFDIDGMWTLSRSESARPDRFPTRIHTGKLSLEVASADEWERLHAIQFGFRLVPAPRR